MKEKSEILLSKLSDKQKSLLSQLSFLDINVPVFSKLKNEKITIADLSFFLLNRDKPYLGNIGKKFAGISTTNSELMEYLKEENLDSLVVKSIEKNTKNGFYGISFFDSQGNVGMSFQGTNITNLGDFLQDSVTDINERVIGNTQQAINALNFFDKNKTSDCKNYLYGHSLGGNLAEHVYLNNFNSIANTFVFNALPIDEDLLDTDEKIAAFNNSHKFTCIVTGGDMVSELASSQKYFSNITFIKNNGSFNNNFLSNHSIEASSFDNHGNFIKVPSKHIADDGFKTNSQKKVINMTNWLAEKLKKSCKRVRVVYHLHKRKKRHKHQKSLEQSSSKDSERIEK